MEKHFCKLCNRSFINGRALGGHMRSHAVATKPAAAPMKSLLAADYSSSSTSSREAEEGKNPRKRFRMVDPKFPLAVQDQESETDAAFSYKRGRSKRRRRRRSETASEILEAELLKSFSDTSPEIDLAITFMLLSRDVWNRYEEPQPSPAKGRNRFQCGSCKKVFRSYQALGGHRASHKKSRSCIPSGKEYGTEEIVSPEANGDGKSAVHVCPICFREFACGQALGGHKRSHQILSSPPPTAKLRECLFDLNLPAPLDDDADLSTVSEAEFKLN